MEKSRKKRDEEEEARLQEALHEFQNAFEHDGSRGGKDALPKTFVRGDVVNAEKGTVPAQVAPPSIYKPTPIMPVKSSRPPLSVEQSKRIAEEAARKIMQQASKSGSRDGGSGLRPAVDRPPKPGSKQKVVERSRMSNLEIFKEELKQVQALRQERKGLRQQLQEKLGVDSETIDRIAPSLDNPYLDGGSSAYDDDPTTTNLYICNFPSDVSMDDIYATFGTFGPLASAKIIYPRPDDPNERKRDFYSGFAAFMVRNDAERALCCMNGEKLRGTEMRVTWGRPVTIPPVPFFVPIALRELAMPDPPSGLPFNARPQGDELKEFLSKHHELPQLNVCLPEGNAQLRRDYDKMLCNSVVRVVVPTERPLLMIIHRVIEFLVREGPLFEALLMAREKANPVYRFLFENHHPTHVYYRWKLYSVLQGDDRSSWRLDRFKMFDDPSGPWWEPPPHSLIENGMPPQLYTTAYMPKRKEGLSTRGSHHRRKRARSDRSRSPESGSDDEVSNNRRRRGDSERRRTEAKKWKGVLDAKERDELEDIIRNLIPERDTIGDATCWCLEHAECAKEIVQCLLESLSIKDTPLHKKIARFYLCSDILANCGTRLRDVFYFRQYFGEVLSQLFVSLNDALESCSRIKAEQFRSRVMLCFRMWEDNSLYPTDVLIQMQNVFLGLTKPNEEPEGAGGETGDDEDLDGAPIADDAMETTGEDIDGVPLEDTAALAAKQQLPPEEAAAVHESRFTTSSWSQVDVESEQRQQPPTTTKWERFTGVSKWEEAPPDTAAASNSSTHAIRISPDHGRRVTKPGNNSNNGVGEDTAGQGENRTSNEPSSSSKKGDEERRRMLREIELKVMTLQDELETDSLPPRRVEEEVASYRRKLMSRMEEKLAREPIKAPGAIRDTEKRSGAERTSRIEQRSGDSSRDEHQRRRSRDRERRSSRDNDKDHSQQPPIQNSGTS